MPRGVCADFGARAARALAAADCSGRTHAPPAYPAQHVRLRCMRSAPSTRPLELLKCTTMTDTCRRQRLRQNPEFDAFARRFPTVFLELTSPTTVFNPHRLAMIWRAVDLAEQRERGEVDDDAAEAHLVRCLTKDANLIEP